jgi:hypothetical protein
MGRTYVSEIDIDATPARVWQVLCDLDAYREWNPFILQASGRAEVGSRLTLHMQPVGGSVRVLRPMVVEARDGELLHWLGRLGVPGILDANHSFTLHGRDGGGTHLVQKEHFGGLLVPIVAGTLERGTLPAFARMNEALKLRAEQAVSSPRG